MPTTRISKSAVLLEALREDLEELLVMLLEDLAVSRDIFGDEDGLWGGEGPSIDSFAPDTVLVSYTDLEPDSLLSSIIYDITGLSIADLSVSNMLLTVESTISGIVDEEVIGDGEGTGREEVRITSLLDSFLTDVFLIAKYKDRLITREQVKGVFLNAIKEINIEKPPIVSGFVADKLKFAVVCTGSKCAHFRKSGDGTCTHMLEYSLVQCSKEDVVVAALKQFRLELLRADAKAV